jgi:uncharacterized protein (TIGR00251 family)
MAELALETRDSGVRFRVRVKPRAKQSRVLGVRDGVLEVAVAAPPVDGAANEELIRTLAGALSVPRGAVQIVSGTAGRSKLIQVRGLSEARVKAAWHV